MNFCTLRTFEPDIILSDLNKDNLHDRDYISLGHLWNVSLVQLNFGKIQLNIFTMKIFEQDIIWSDLNKNNSGQRNMSARSFAKCVFSSIEFWNNSIEFFRIESIWTWYHVVWFKSTQLMTKTLSAWSFAKCVLSSIEFCNNSIEFLKDDK